MNLTKAKELLAAAKSSPHLYEEQAAAMQFAQFYGEELLELVEACEMFKGLTITESVYCTTIIIPNVDTPILTREPEKWLKLNESVSALKGAEE